MAKPIVIVVSPVAENPPAILPNPVDPQELAEDIHACAEQGASMVHLHVRDDCGQPTADPSIFSATLDLIRQQDDIVIQSTTCGPSTWGEEDHCACLHDPRVEVAQLNMGSTNIGELVYINTRPDLRYWAERIMQANVRTELEISDVSMVANVRTLAQEGLLPQPLFYGFTLGYPGIMPATSTAVWTLRKWIAPDTLWGLSEYPMRDLSLVSFALSSGATFVRIGYENSYSVIPGRPYMRNADMVAHLAQFIRIMGLEVATPEQARNILCISQAN